MYSSDQLARYFSHVGWDAECPEQPGTLAHLSRLVTLQLARVPFECLSLHYSKSHVLSLDPTDLYHKIVERGKGGYCMEINTFFATVLRSLGYTLIAAGGRISDETAGRPGGGYQGWSHMVILVTIEDTRYLVDVGFGANGPCRPLPLISGQEFMGIEPQLLKLEYKALAPHTDSTQRMWVYCHRANREAPWIDAYAFTTVEYFADDFRVLNLATMTLRQSLFVQSVICIRFLLDPKKLEIEGVAILFCDQFRRKIRGESYDSLKLSTEAERIQVLEQYFDIKLTEEERCGIIGLHTELKSSKRP